MTNEEIEKEAEKYAEKMTGPYFLDWQDSKEAFLAGYKFRDKLSGWISVEERLPEECEYVLAYNGSIPFRGFVNGYGKWMLYYYDGVDEAYPPVTHWMPLPEPPLVP